jgi:hypothetical protein
MAVACLYNPHRGLARQEWPSARVAHPRGGRHDLAGWPRAWRAPPPEDGGTDTPRRRGLRERQPSVLLREVRETILLPHTRDTVGPPGLPGPGTLAQAMQGGRQGLVATDVGARTAPRQRLLRGRSAVLSPGMPHPPPLRVPPAVPVQLPQGLRWLWARLDEHLLPHRAPQTFFACCGGRRMRPQRPPVLAQREPPVARLGAARAPTARQGGAWCCHLRDMDAGGMPAPCSCSRHKTGGRIAPLLLPSGPRALVTRLCQGECSGLPRRVMRPLDTIEREAGRLAPRGLAGRPHRRCHGLRNTQATDRPAGRGAPVDPASPAPIPWHAPWGAALDTLELAPAAPAPPQAPQPRRSPCGRAPGGGGWPSPLGLQALVVLKQ